jgi:hypothetical protein
MSIRFINDTQIITSNGNHWLLAQLRQTFGRTQSQKIEDVARKESFTNACIYKRDDSLVAVFANNAPINSYFVGENFAKYVSKVNGSKNAICVESFGLDEYLLIIVLEGEITVEKRVNNLDILTTLAELVRTKQYKDTHNPSNKKLVFSLHVHGINPNDFSDSTSDLCDVLSYLSDIEDVRGSIQSQSIIDAFDKEPFYPAEKIKIALSHIKNEEGNAGISLVPVFILVVALLGAYFVFTGNEEEVKETKVNPYELYYSTVKNKYVNIYPRLVNDYNILILLERDVPNWSVSTITLDKGFTAYKMVPVRSEAKVIELREFSDKNSLQFDSDSQGYTILAKAESFSIFGKDYRKIFSIEDVHQYLDDAFVEGIPSTQLLLVKDVPNGTPPSMTWVVRELTLNLTSTAYEDLLAIGGVVLHANGEALPVLLGGDETSGTAIGTLNVDHKTRTLTGALSMSVFGKRK